MEEHSDCMLVLLGATPEGKVRGSSVHALELLGDLAHASERFHPCPLVLPDPQLWPIDRPQAGDKRMRRRLEITADRAVMPPLLSCGLPPCALWPCSVRAATAPNFR